MKKIILYLVLSIVIIHCNLEDDEELKTKIIVALDKSIRYFGTKYNRIPLDVVYGLRLVQGLLGPETNTENLMFITLSRRADAVCKKTIPMLKKNDKKYYDGFKLAIQNPITPLSNTGSLPPAEIVSDLFRSLDNFDEKKSDVCLKQALKCKITKKCLKSKTESYTSGYTLTHQVKKTFSNLTK